MKQTRACLSGAKSAKITSQASLWLLHAPQGTIQKITSLCFIIYK